MDLRIVRGEPDEAELAAVVAVLCAAACAPPTVEQPAPSPWWVAHRTRRGLTPRPGSARPAAVRAVAS